MLEVMLAVAIMALVAVAIYRFVVGSLLAIRYTNEDTAQKGAVQALVAVLTEEFSNLPTAESAALMGEGHQFNGKASDEVEWLTQGGNGMFTDDAPGLWKVTLLLRPQDKTYTLGILRQDPTDPAQADNWLPLLPNVDAIEIRYYDQRLNTWLEKWSDATARPALVRVRIWRTDQTVPYESVIELPPTKLPS